MAKKNHDKSIIKDIAICLSICGPLLFIIIGYFIKDSGGFDGTVMEQLYPAISFGFIAVYMVIIILSNIFKYSTIIWVIGTIIIFAATVILYMFELTSILTVGVIVLSVVICILGLINWIAAR